MRNIHDTIAGMHATITGPIRFRCFVCLPRDRLIAEGFRCVVSTKYQLEETMHIQKITSAHVKSK